ncbi:MAG: hypothetical protein ACPG46_07025 [Thalassotalea sp.]
MNIKKSCLILFSVVVSSCANQQDNCEKIRVVKEQLHQCSVLERQIAAASNKPIVRTELERRYQESCVNIRYYRDEHHSAICEV